MSSLELFNAIQKIRNEEEQMGLRQLIQVATLLAALAVSSGRLLQILHAVRLSQLELIELSKASYWVKAVLLLV